MLSVNFSVVECELIELHWDSVCSQWLMFKNLGRPRRGFTYLEIRFFFENLLILSGQQGVIEGCL